MKTKKPTWRLKTKSLASHLTLTFNSYRKYKSHKKLVHPDLL